MTINKYLSSDEIRDSFLNYFVKKKHITHPSSSLIPANDPTLLLTNSGMAQFKSYFQVNQNHQNQELQHHKNVLDLPILMK